MLEIVAPKIELRCIHTVHIDVRDAELVNLGIEARQHILGAVDGNHPAGWTDGLRRRQRQRAGPAGRVQNLVPRWRIEMRYQTIRVKGLEAQRLALRTVGYGV